MTDHRVCMKSQWCSKITMKCTHGVHHEGPNITRTSSAASVSMDDSGGFGGLKLSHLSDLWKICTCKMQWKQTYEIFSTIPLFFPSGGNNHYSPVNPSVVSFCISKPHRLNEHLLTLCMPAYYNMKHRKLAQQIDRTILEWDSDLVDLV